MSDNDRSQNPLRLQEINTSLERRLFVLLIVGGILFSFIGENLYYLGSFPEQWVDWSTDGTNGGYIHIENEIRTTLGRILMELGYCLSSNFGIPILVIAIKVLTVNPIEMHALNIKPTAIVLARIYCGFMLIWNLFIFVQSGTDFIIAISFVFSCVCICIFIWFLIWLRHKKTSKYNVIVDMLMFNKEFLKAYFILVFFIGIWLVGASYFVVWWEGDWAYEYYDEDGSLSIFKNFDYMVSTLRTTGIAITVVGILGSIFTFFKTK